MINNIIGLFGTGRSGTTWLGSIIATSSDIEYRFEPFHRRMRKDQKVKDLVNYIQSESFSGEDIESIYTCLLNSYAEWDKPPFFRKKDSRNFLFGKRIIWPFAKKNKLFNSLFRYLYTPKSQPTIFFKEVSMINVLINLVKKTNIPIIYIIRHPCGVINSLITGHKSNLMREKNKSIVKNFIAKYNPELIAKYESKWERMSVIEIETLLWITETEFVIKNCQNESNFLLIVYEELSINTLPVVNKIFNYLGKNLTQETIDFIEKSKNKSLYNRIIHGEIFANSYFTVFRNSEKVSNNWKHNLGKENKNAIMTIVEESFVFKYIYNMGFWH